MSGAGEDQTVVIGAGVSGLACARALARAGRRVVVLERARGVGGRCATHRVDGRPVDFGVVFLHGRAPAFLAALDEVAGTRLSTWPASVRGAGRPCQPEAFSPGERRVAFVEGISAFPKHLSRGLDVRTRARVTALGLEAGAIRLVIEDAPPLEAGTVVLALATEQAAGLLRTLPSDEPALDTARALLDMVRSQPCLALTASYAGARLPPWDVSYPEASPILQLIANDSSKRGSGAPLTYVFQAHARWSRAHLEDEGWPALMLAEAGRILGPEAASPDRVEPHRWRYARTDRSAELSEPLLLRLPGGKLLGLAGEIFSPGAGVEAAFLSGEQLARQILAEAGPRWSR